MQRVLISIFLVAWSFQTLHGQEQPVFRAGVDVVVVDATVVDSDGNPVKDLTPQDFQILVDGKPRRMTSLEFISQVRTVGREEPIEEPAKSEKPTHYTTNEGAQPGRLVLIVVDRGAIQSGEGRVAMVAVAQFVDSLDPSDRVGLFTMPPGGSKVDFTFDHERIKNALGSVAGVASGRVVSVGGWNVGMTEAIAINRGDRFTLAEVYNRECWDPVTKQMDPLCLREVPQLSRRMVDQAHQQVRDSLVWLLEIVEALQFIEEPKTLVLVAEGYLHDQETYGYFRQFARAAAKARVNLYGVQFESLVMDMSRSRASPTRSEDMDIETDGLGDLAGMAGGALFRATGSGSSAFTRLERELTGYYLLSFEAEENDRDGRPHQITVRLPGRSGIAIRSREEFIIPPEPAARTDADRIADALREPFMRSDLPIAVSTFNVKDSRTLEPKLLVTAAIGDRQSPPSEAMVGFTVIDEKGKELENKAEKLTRSTAVREPLPFAASVPATPGTYTLKLAAIDGQGRLGSVEHVFRAELPKTEGLELSDLLLLDPAFELEKTPLTSTVTTAAGDLGMYLEIYSEDTDLLQGLSVSFEIAPDETGASLVHTIESAKQSIPYGRWIAEGSVSLESLAPADYLARAIVSKSGRSIASLTRPFRLERGMETLSRADLEAIPEGPPRDYAALIDHFQRGRTIGAASSLSKMSRDDLEKARVYFEDAKLHQAHIKAAALLHTEAAMGTGIEEAYHLDRAQGWMDQIEDASSRRRFQKRLFLAVGLHFWKLTRAEEALAFLKKASDVDPEDVEPVIAMASIYEAIGWVARRPVESLERAEETYRRVLKADPENVEAHLRLGHVHKIQGHRDTALRELTWVLEHATEPDFKLVAHLLMGDLHKSAGSFPEAIESYRTALSIDPICQAAATALSQTLHHVGDLAGSREVLERFVERKGSRAGGFDGWWRYLHGDPKRIQSLLAELGSEIR